MYDYIKLQYILQINVNAIIVIIVLFSLLLSSRNLANIIITLLMFKLSLFVIIMIV